MPSPPPDQQFPPWLLRSRILPPRQQRRLIARPRLMSLLEKTQPGQIVLACAPPGFGKSVTLAEWSERVQRDGGRGAWLALDSADEPATLVEYLKLAFHCAGLVISDLPESSEGACATTPTLQLQLILAAAETSQTLCWSSAAPR